MAAEAEAQAAAVLEQLQRVGAKVFFEKQLTSSDVSASGRVVVPKVRGWRGAAGGRQQGAGGGQGRAAQRSGGLGARARAARAPPTPAPLPSPPTPRAAAHRRWPRPTSPSWTTPRA
jgi:hypothetical protein